MKASAETSKKATVTPAKQNISSSKVEEKPFFAPALPIQTKMKISQVNDPMEREADQTAVKVMRMADPVKNVSTIGSNKLQRKVQAPEIKRKTNENLQKKVKENLNTSPLTVVHRKSKDGIMPKGEGTAKTTTDEIANSIRQQSNSGGTPLSEDTRGFMESRFNADFSNVRIHNNTESANLNNQVGAKAFAYENNIFFNKNQYQPNSHDGKQLLAHELTHTIQQGGSVQRTATNVNTTATTAPQIQRFGIPSWQDVLDWIAGKAYHIPGFRMFTIIIGSNPINGEVADRSAANILRAIVEFLPGGHLITQALDKYNVFEKAGSWVEGQMKRFSGLLGKIKTAFKQFTDGLDFLDIVTSPGKTWDKAKRIFSEPINEVIDFIKSIFQAIFQFIRDAVLKPLATLAKNSRGFDLLCAVLGQNPITGEVVPRNADTLIGGFMKLIGREDIWENIKKGNAIQRAYLWFQNAMKGLVAIVKQFPKSFIAMLKSIEVMDFIVLPNLFAKVFKVFGDFAGNLFNWAFNTIFDLLEIIFSVVAPGAMPYLAKVRSSFRSIIEKPMDFVKNLINAVKQGFNQFAKRIGEHLKKALIGWLLGSLQGANLYIPQSFTLKEILKLVLSVFGLTWQNIRAKLVKAIGETAVGALETGFDIIKTLITEGPAAAWDKIKEKIDELKAQFVSEVTNFVTVTVVQTAITKLLTSLNPAGAFIQAIIAIYNTIMFVVQKIKQIAQVGMGIINSIVEIASGNIAKAANKVESTLGNLLTLAISFLANFLGLGKISDKVVAIIQKLRAPVDKALDKLVDWIASAGKAFIGKAKEKLFDWLGIKKSFTDKGKHGHSLYFQGKDENAKLIMASTPLELSMVIGKLEGDENLKDKSPLSTAKKALSEIESIKKREKDAKKAKPLIEKQFEIIAIALSKLDFSGEKGEMPLFVVKPFKLKKSLIDGKDKHGYHAPGEGEFSRQLDLQEKGINNMIIEVWLKRVTDFPSIGRSKEGDAKSKAQREQLIIKEVDRLVAIAIMKNEKYSYKNIYERVNKTMAVLHRVDQVAGGEGTDIVDLGSSRVDFSIGAAWKSRLGGMKEAANKVKNKSITKMNIRLSYIKT